MYSSAKTTKFIGRREVRELIARAKREGRAFEDVFLEMYPEDDSADDEDDCRPIDGVTIDSFDDRDPSDAATQTTEYATRTEDSFRPVRRPIRHAVANKDNATVDSTSSNASRNSSEPNIYEQTLNEQADRHCLNRLLQDVLEVWIEESHIQLQHAELADLRYDEKTLRKYLGVIDEKINEINDTERKKRLKMFIFWRDRRLVVWALHSWILRHRENYVRKLTTDANNARAATTALTAWREAAMELRERKSHFRKFFHACKFGRRWLEIVNERRILRSMAVLEQRYKSHKKEKEERFAERIISKWHARIAAIEAMEVTAIQHEEHQIAQRAQHLAHSAITTMYLTTAQTSNNEAKAEHHYMSTITSQIIAFDGSWRTQTRKTSEQESTGDEFALLRDQSRAQHAIRLMRRTTTRGRQMEEQADAHHAQLERNKAQDALRRWRAEVAMKRGEAVVQEPPATPAARLTALRLGQSQIQSQGALALRFTQSSRM